MNNDNNAIKLTKEKREEMIAAIKTYFLNKKEEELGLDVTMHGGEAYGFDLETSEGKNASA